MKPFALTRPIREGSTGVSAFFLPAPERLDRFPPAARTIRRVSEVRVDRPLSLIALDESLPPFRPLVKHK